MKNSSNKFRGKNNKEYKKNSDFGYYSKNTNRSEKNNRFLNNSARNMRVENSKNLAPLGLSENNILNSDVKKGDPIEIKNIDITDNQLYKYWLSQNS